MLLREIIVYVSAYIGLFAITFYFLSFYTQKKRIYPDIPKDKDLPKVSIIIPAWNEGKGISGTIKSALNLDYPKDKLEIIVIDDGSKDDTYYVAKKFENKGVRVFRNKKNMGKGASMNFGIEKSKGDVIVTMDADNIIVEGDILKKMVSHFQNERVMCVAPTPIVHNPKGVLQRIQQVEYLLGIFLMQSFSSMNTIHITSGAFSVYRKSFFDKYGLFDTTSTTEDMEMALRIQYNNYIIVNDVRAVAYTIAPKKLWPLIKQRRRWYSGNIKCLLKYKKIFSKKYGVIGLIVLPSAIITILFAVLLMGYLVVKTFLDLRKEIIFLNSINFRFLNAFEFDKFVIEHFFFSLISNPITYFLFVFLSIMIACLIFAKKKIKKYTDVRISIFFYVLFYSFFLTFWWVTAYLYVLFNRKVVWR
jgi:cellulose synthase/poly-beta-1,6-N-acetylglucosamine synthase-like glycosyltransferase